MKVLILINKVGLGDCIIHLNYIHEISKKYEKPVSILAKENTRAKDLFQDDPHIKEVITLDRLEDNTGSHDGLNGFIKLEKDIKEKVDTSEIDTKYIPKKSLTHYLMEDGDVFIFDGKSQMRSTHAVLDMKGCGERINLTFRSGV